MTWFGLLILLGFGAAYVIRGGRPKVRTSPATRAGMPVRRRDDKSGWRLFWYSSIAGTTVMTLVGLLADGIHTALMLGSVTAVLCAVFLFPFFLVIHGVKASAEAVQDAVEERRYIETRKVDRRAGQLSVNQEESASGGLSRTGSSGLSIHDPESDDHKS